MARGRILCQYAVLATALGACGDNVPRVPAGSSGAAGTVDTTRGEASEGAPTTTAGVGTTAVTGVECDEGTSECRCAPAVPGPQCAGTLVCVDEVCQSDAATGTTSGATTGSTGAQPSECGNGRAEAGDLCLGVAVTLAMGMGPTAIVLFDSDDNGTLDIATADFVGNTVSLRPGSGAGVFGVLSSFATSVAPQSIAVGDINDDTTLDIVTADHGANTISLLVGDGLGSFAPPTILATTAALPAEVVVGDVTGDTLADVIVTTHNGVVLVVTNKAQLTFATGTDAQGLALADFIDNNALDMLTTNPSTAGLSLRLGNGVGGFGEPVSTGVPLLPVHVSSGDFNMDGNLDAITLNQGPGTVSVVFGTGIGGFAGQLPTSVGAGPRGMVVVDFDLDGLLDIAVAATDELFVRVFLGRGDGTFELGAEFATPSGAIGLATGDINQDGLPDLVTANQASSNVTVILSDA